MSYPEPEQHRPPPEMSPEDYERCRPATQVDRLEAAIPTHLTSNGEYFPPFFQTPQQQQVELRVNALADVGTRKLGMDRRRFLATTAGMAASFIAMNEVHRASAHGDTFFEVEPEGVFDHHAFLSGGPPADLFVFDDQLHIVRGQGGMGHIGTLLRAFAQGETARTPNSPFPVNPLNPSHLPDENGNPWGCLNPLLINETNWDDTEYWLTDFIKMVYIESQTAVGVISNVASGTAANAGDSYVGTRNVREARAQELLTAEQTYVCREFINDVAGSNRALAHGLLYMGPGNIYYLEEQIERFDPDSWKGYQNSVAKRDNDPNTFFEPWRFDDEELAFPTFEFISKDYRRNGKRKPGRNNVCVHKGLGESSRPEDIEVAAKAFPDLNFVIYHSCIRPGFFFYDALEDVKSKRMRDGVPDLLDVAEFAQRVADIPNVYAELGTTFACSVVTFPSVAAHLLGILFKYLGADRIVWGTDSCWYGGPQWQIEAFWRFQIPEALRKAHGYPVLTKQHKRKVLGLNSARLYGMTTDLSRYNEVPADFHDRITPELNSIMEYDDRLPNELPVEGTPSMAVSQLTAESPYGPASAVRGDKMDRIVANYHDMYGTPQGIARKNERYGWIRVR